MKTRQKRSRFQLFHERAERIERRLHALAFDELDAAMSSPSAAREYSSHLLGSRIIPIAERLDSDTIQVVVQGFLPFCWGSSFKHVHVGGFRRFRDGRMELMQSEELYAYD